MKDSDAIIDCNAIIDYTHIMDSAISFVYLQFEIMEEGEE